MSGRETFDVSPVERKILQDRAERRAVLRHECLKQIHNPYRHALGIGGTVEDTAISRYMALRATGYDTFKPTWKNGLFQLAVVVFPIFVVGYIVKKTRDEREHSYRTGQVSYRDRHNKFI